MMVEPDTPAASPRLERWLTTGGVAVWTDRALARDGILVAFTERGGGASAPPFDSLNLAAHVGDDPQAVDANRTRLLESLGYGRLRERLVTAEQVHGSHVALVGRADAGAGAFARGVPPVAGTDALMTVDAEVPLLMLYADCVPVVLVATDGRGAISVVHAGWRGALAGLPGRAAARLASAAGCRPSDLVAYIGPHIGACCYEVGDDILSQFCNTFDTIGAVDGRLDLAAAVRESLIRTGLGSDRIAETGLCTRDHTDRFFSYRAAPVTGRHGALAVIAEGEYDEPASRAEQHRST